MDHFDRIANCLEWMVSEPSVTRSLDDVADYLGLSPAHAQRLFKRAVGLSPKQFSMALNLARSRCLLAANQSVLDTALEVGLSGPSRLHDLFVNVEAMTPGEFRLGGAGLRMAWGVHPSPLGDVLVCVSDRGVAGIEFVAETLEDSLSRCRARWPAADFEQDQSSTVAVAQRLFSPERLGPVELLLAGTPFQIQVWQALLTVPDGTGISYSQLARRIGRPSSHRAVASAVGANPIAVLIPCHRVIRATGAFGDYRWGAARKLALLAREQHSRSDAHSL